MTTTTNYFAVCNANGLISRALLGRTKSEAVAELKDAIADRASVDWIDDSSTDLEDACECNCDGMSYSDALAHCQDNGGSFVWGDQSDDSWDIWSVDETW
jgi:hypothetical protein